MRLSSCQNCGQLVYFENVSCTRCGLELGFMPQKLEMTSLEMLPDGLLKPSAATTSTATYRHCANRVNYQVCNWLVKSSDPDPLCIACRLNKTIPDLSVAGNINLWLKVEAEKKRLIYSLLVLGLPVVQTTDDPNWLTFEFLADPDPTFSESGRVFTGHADGVITLNIAEADPVIRERMRVQMAEPYRTPLGHFRHESGHYFWDRLVRDSHWLGPVRELFGDDSLDYAEALKNHYENGAPSDWQTSFVSAYATMHPWEDWAESWAHYLHILDTLETAYAFGLKIRPNIKTDTDLNTGIEFNPYDQKDFSKIIERWLPLTYALNSLSRSMGHEHIYPFVLTEITISKLDLIHRIVQENHRKN